LLENGGRIGWVPLAVYNRDGQMNSSDQAMGLTCLCAAAMEGHLDVVRLLIAAGSDVNQARSADGATPLFLAAMSKHAAVVEALIEAGADVNLAFPTTPPEKNGQGPL
jgi:ankyrin repeat protein